MTIQVKELTKKFGKTTVVENVTFSVERGQVLGFLGLNGAGKSTTMKMIAGFLEPDVGSVEIEGVHVQEEPKAAKSKLGYLPEGIAIYGDMPVHSYLAFVARVRGIRRKELAEKLSEVVSVLEIQSVLTQRVSTLSKGYLRRVGLAQALLHDPDYLVLDEPTEGLDPRQRGKIRDLISRLGESKAIILSTHILEDVEALCDRVIIIDKGHLVVDTTLDSLVEMSNVHKALRLKVNNARPKDVEEKLLQVSEIASLGYDENDASFRLVPKSGKSLIERIWILADQYGWRIQTLVEEAGNLERIFLNLTSEEEAKLS